MPPKKTLLQAVRGNEPSSRRAGRNQREAREGMGNIGRIAGRVIGTRRVRNGSGKHKPRWQRPGNMVAVIACIWSAAGGY